MSGLLTTLAFVALTALFVALHLRKGRGAAAAATKACPRCGTPLAGSSTVSSGAK